MVSSTGEYQVGLIGTSFRQVGFEGLGPATAALTDYVRRAALKEALGVSELVVLATCNRLECYVAAARLDAQRLRARAAKFFQRELSADLLQVELGRPAVEHLFAVVSSLDSFVVGETDVVRQVRRAIESAQAEGLAEEALGHVFERALQCARRVHAETALGSTPVSVATLAVQKIQRHFGELGPSVSLLVGTGDMTRKVGAAMARYAQGERIFVNRTLAGAEELAERFDGRAMSLAQLHASPPDEIDLVFSATSASEPVIPAATLGPAIEARVGCGRAPMIVCDLGVPRDVDPSLEGREGIVLLALEHLEVLAELNRTRLEDELEQARLIVRDLSTRLSRERRFRALADRSTQAILESRLAHLDPQDRDAILKFATGLAERFARQPDE